MKLIIASNNAHKIYEIKKILSGKFEEIISLCEAGIDHETVEDGDTFMENALKKAREIAAISGAAALADDSGICCDALDGAPGVHSARYAGDHDSEANMTKLLHELEKKPNRSAQFRTVVALILNGQEVLFEGIVTGKIATERHYGDSGFGYDPIFIPDGYSETFSQMSSQGKNLISHRGRAVRKLADYLKTL